MKKLQTFVIWRMRLPQVLRNFYNPSGSDGAGIMWRQGFPDHSGIFEPSNISGDFNGIYGQSVGNGTADSDDTCSLQAFTESGNKGL